MRTSLSAVALLVALAFSTGCVSEGKYNDLLTAYRNSQEQVASGQSQIEELKNRIKLLQGDPQGTAAKIADLEKQLADATAKFNELNTRYDALSGRIGTGTVLPAALDQALKEFAAAHPDLVEYDSTLGMVKFKSDLTFKLGSADLSDHARNTLSQLATILNSPEASKYEVRVVGHTDNVRIARAETRAKHPDNWFLSAHRAIAVREALGAAGVQPVRTSVMGYSMYRPVVSNGKLGAEKNRRVEIYLVNMAIVNPELLGGGEHDAPAAPVGPAPKKADELPLK